MRARQAPKAMLTPTEIRSLAERKYYDYLKATVKGESFFPWPIRFGRPSTSDDFAKLCEQTAVLIGGNFGYTIEFEEKNTRRYGVQRLPAQVKFESEEQFIAALGKRHERDLFRANVTATKARLPNVEPWLISHVRWIIEFAADWEGILAVCEYFLRHPRPGLYIRQLPIPVHTKFIQEHKEVLTSLLNAILPEGATNPCGKDFEERFGLKPVEHTIRFRALDEAIIQSFHLTDERMGLPLDRFRTLPAAGLWIIITENLMNLECLPPIPNGMGIWGQGNAAERLARVDWLNSCRVLYWGDIDEHGLCILSRLRATYPGIRSNMMDIHTLKEFRSLCGVGEKVATLPKNLTTEERAAFDAVAEFNLRLEQEKIPLAYSNRALLRQIQQWHSGSGKDIPE